MEFASNMVTMLLCNRTPPPEKTTKNKKQNPKILTSYLILSVGRLRVTGLAGVPGYLYFRRASTQTAWRGVDVPYILL